MIPDAPACERIRAFTAGRATTSLAPNSMTPARSGPVAPVGLVTLLLGLAFSAFYAGTSRGVFVFGDDILMHQVTEAIWERGELAVTSHAPRDDVASGVPGSDGRRYAKYGLGPSLVALPFYGASHRLFDRLELPETADAWGNLRTGPTIFGTGLANAATGGATVAVTFLLAVELGYPLLVGLLTAACLGSATLMAHYASTFLSEPLSALCLTVTLLGLLKAKGKGSVKGQVPGRWWLAISGFAAGLAVATKLAHVVIVVPFFLWAAVLGWRGSRHRGLIRYPLYWSFCFSVWLAAIGAYNWSRFGSFFETGYGGEAGNFTTTFAVGFLGLIASPAKGIFWYCPVLLLALVGARGFWRRDRDCALAILAASASWLLLISRYYQWYGGGSWGPRFLVPLLPLWILPVGEVLSRWRRGRSGRATTAIVVAVGLVAAMIPLLVPFDTAGGLVLTQGEVEASAWKVADSPVLLSLAHLPRAFATTAAKLAGRQALGEAGRPLSGPRFPDFACEHYGSHALLVWTRACFLFAALALGLALAMARRARDGGSQGQKALLSSPPQ